MRRGIKIKNNYLTFVKKWWCPFDCVLVKVDLKKEYNKGFSDPLPDNFPEKFWLNYKNGEISKTNYEKDYKFKDEDLIRKEWLQIKEEFLEQDLGIDTEGHRV